jgi:hypothetical protein
MFLAQQVLQVYKVTMAVLAQQEPQAPLVTKEAQALQAQLDHREAQALQAKLEMPEQLALLV